MAVLKKTTSILRKLKRDESGTAALSWALSLTAIIGAMGAAMDFAMLSSADSRAQTISDTTALAAAIYVKNHEIVPTDREKGLIGEYTAAELGYTFKNWVINEGTKKPKVNVSYDNVKREATVTVTGYTKPTLVQILGFDDLAFKAETVVKYYEKDIQDPASIVMVLDNSGSMAFDDLPIDDVTGLSPPSATRRMDGLQAASKSFMDILETAVGPQPQDGTVDLVLRTGMMAFDSGIVRTSPMNWGYIPDSEFDSMVPLAATNSAPPLSAANTWLNINEPPVHEANLPGKTPLKYIVLMTDGKNTVGTEEWVARSGTENWRRWVTGRETAEGLSEVEATDVEITPATCDNEIQGYNRQCAYNVFPDINWTWGPYESDPGPYTGTAWGYTYSCNSEPNYELVCHEATYETRYSGFEYAVGEDAPDNSGTWEEGEFDITSNIQTREECDELHAAGVEIFSVGFALVPGQFETNEWASRSGGYSPYPSDANYTPNIGVENANKAKAILQYCASKPENFITANNTASLQSAFDRIGNTIIKEIIRISS